MLEKNKKTKQEYTGKEGGRQKKEKRNKETKKWREMD